MTPATPRSGWLVTAIGMVVVGAAVAVAAFALAPSETDRKVSEAGSPPVTTTTTSSPPTSDGMADMDDMDDMAGMGPASHPNHRVTRPLTAAEQSDLEVQLEAAQSALPGLTVADALAHGFRVTDPGDGRSKVHLVRNDLEHMDRTVFDPHSPPILYAEGPNGSDRIIALVYWVESDSPPEGFAGPSDVWHHHGLQCETGAGIIATVQNADLTAEQCRAMSGRIVSVGGWMLHLWDVPGVAPPSGNLFGD